MPGLHFLTILSIRRYSYNKSLIFDRNMASKLRLAILASRFPYPIEKGDKLRLYHQIRHLAEDFDLYLFALTEHEITAEHHMEVSRFCRKIFIYRESGRTRKLRVIRHFAGKLPAQLRYFYSREIQRKMQKDLFKINPDVLYCQLYRMAPYPEGIRAPKVLDIMDSFGTIAELYGTHARWFYERWFWQKEYHLIRKYESEKVGEFQHFTVISERDAGQLDLPENAPVSIVRNGIDVNYFQQFDSGPEKPEFDMTFVGNMEYNPNIEAVRFIRNQIIPVFDQHEQPVRILVGGKGAEKLEKSVGAHPSLHFHGWYEDIRAAYYSARIFIAPLFLGSGMQNKVLEAIASNRPVICSSHVIDAMPMLRELVYIADRPEDFLSHYLTLKRDSYQQEKQKEALAVLKNELTWQRQNETLKKIIHDAGKSFRWDIARYH